MKASAAFLKKSKEDAAASLTVGSEKALIQKYKNAQQSGVLNLSSQNLDSFPQRCFRLHECAPGDEDRFWEFTPTTKIDVSFNSIAVIPSDIGMLADLTTLIARNNNINEWPSELSNCESLRHIDLSDNKLVQMHPSSSISSLRSLRDIILRGNGLTAMPEGIYQCLELQLIDLRDNKISHVAESICNLSKLTTLNLSQNALSSLPQTIANCRKLETLDVHKNVLNVIPSLSSMSNLSFLDVTENRLSTLPQVCIIPGRSKLTRLHAGSNRINAWGTVFDQLQESRTSSGNDSANSCFTELHVENNQLRSIPTAIFLCNALKVLDVSNNDINDLPNGLGFMSVLQRISIEGNPIKSIRRSLLSESTVNLKTFLRSRCADPSLYTDGQSAHEKKTSFMESSSSAEAVMEGQIRNCIGGNGILKLSKMKLNYFPASSISKIVRVSNGDDEAEYVNPFSEIDLSHNDFDHLPTSSLNSLLSSCSFVPLQGRSVQGDEGFNGRFSAPASSSTTALVPCNSLNLSHNKLGSKHPISSYSSSTSEVIPTCITQLNISHNNITTGHLNGMVFEVSPMKNSAGLRVILANNNSIDDIPSSFSNLGRTLCELQLSNNRLTSLDGIDFRLFPMLETCNVSDNKIVSISNMWESKKLSTIMLDNNNITIVPAELSLLPCLRSITLYGNPQRTVRSGILDKGTDAIIACLKNKMVTTPQVSQASRTTMAGAKGFGGGSRNQDQDTGFGGGSRNQDQDRGFGGGSRDQCTRMDVPMPATLKQPPCPPTAKGVNSFGQRDMERASPQYDQQQMGQIGHGYAAPRSMPLSRHCKLQYPAQPPPHQGAAGVAGGPLVEQQIAALTWEVNQLERLLDLPSTSSRVAMDTKKDIARKRSSIYQLQQSQK